MAAKKRRKKKYRIPHKRGKNGKVWFPTMPELFGFVVDVVGDLLGAVGSGRVYDNMVGSFVYPGYPYTNPFKLGKKNVRSVVELSLLAHNLGVPLEWLQRIRSGRWTREDATAAYHKRKGKAAFAAGTSYTGKHGTVSFTVRVRDDDPMLLGDAYVAALTELRRVVAGGDEGGGEGTFL